MTTRTMDTHHHHNVPMQQRFQTLDELEMELNHAAAAKNSTQSAEGYGGHDFLKEYAMTMLSPSAADPPITVVHSDALGNSYSRLAVQSGQSTPIDQALESIENEEDPLDYYFQHHPESHIYAKMEEYTNLNLNVINMGLDSPSTTGPIDNHDSPLSPLSPEYFGPSAVIDDSMYHQLINGFDNVQLYSPRQVPSHSMMDQHHHLQVQHHHHQQQDYEHGQNQMMMFDPLVCGEGAATIQPLNLMPSLDSLSSCSSPIQHHLDNPFMTHQQQPAALPQPAPLPCFPTTTCSPDAIYATHPPPSPYTQHHHHHNRSLTQCTSSSTLNSQPSNASLASRLSSTSLSSAYTSVSTASAAAKRVGRHRSTSSLSSTASTLVSEDCWDAENPDDVCCSDTRTVYLFVNENPAAKGHKSTSHHGGEDTEDADQTDDESWDRPSTPKPLKRSSAPTPLTSPSSQQNNTFKCTCGKLFKKLSNLKLHYKHHLPPTPASSTAKPFMCTDCPKGFMRKHDLKRHAVTHAKSFKPVGCEACETTFTRVDALLRHVRGGRCRGRGVGNNVGRGNAHPAAVSCVKVEGEDDGDEGIMA